jgi:transposase-like protein
MKTRHRSESLNLLDIVTRYPDDASARRFLESLRWPSGAVCPHCGVVGEAARIPQSKPSIRAGLWRCTCTKHFTVTVGTVFESSKLPLNKWLIAWHLVCASKKGIAALELKRLIGVNYKTAWFMLMRIRESLASGALHQLSGIVEADAGFIGNNGRITRLGRYEKKSAVLVMVQREGEVRSMVVAGENKQAVNPAISQHIDPSSALMTDGAHCYKAIGKSMAHHGAVDHTRKEYVRGQVHTGTADVFVGLLKRGQYGVFHNISKRHLPRYLAEFNFRFSMRFSSDGTRTAKGLENLNGKRLKRKELWAR